MASILDIQIVSFQMKIHMDMERMWALEFAQLVVR
jgi:hypothetical protein